ncbi:MAG TPA: hypothetical protein VGR15_10600 [Bacteroidota bacterium]|jgi:hypothetical protein|nr:hypothetical protein [Bacteroidota bacterium]
MKILASISIIILVTLNVSAQPHFPLELEDDWGYEGDDIITEGTLIISTVVGDTVIENGRRYSVIDGSMYGYEFLRQKGFEVIAYDPLDSNEFVLLDFAASPSETVSVHSQGHITTIALGQLTTSRWTFHVLANFSLQPLNECSLLPPRGGESVTRHL